MTLTELRYIVSLARTRHFGRAAEACFVSQPTLSVAIRKLEEELGVALFERGASEISVTPVGERIVEQAQRVLEESATIKSIAQQGRDQLVGPLRLGAIYTIAPYLLPSLIPALHQLAPQMPLHLEENFTARLAERLKQGELDVIVIALPFAEPGVVTQALYDEPFMVAMPKTHAWCKKKLIPGAQLAEENLLLLGSGHCFRDQVLQACPALNRSSAAPGSMQRTFEGSSLETIRHMVASGAGITVLPCSAIGPAQHESKLLAFRPFATPVPGRRVALAWRKSFPRPQALEAVRQAALAALLPCVAMLDLPAESY
ncbi:LysR family transcriptional regulator [Sulfurimicrobium lacus]|uniref:LysR family transcriptional regulator n=1 Tax=Sulfurimicrobium lacus TaxID=2715678 RepID=A0A6F8VA04_9PROT|nr:hydrogen peroxide-inducible genes activator [Sulfurimicrobium lacus]BCB26538.1 LysR family transcriptional regulator [Sulfurimicrobium lacus]